MPWWRDAACRDIEVDFFAISHPETRAALEVCARCPVREECLLDALEYEATVPSKHYFVGVLGGRRPTTRAVLLGKR